MINTCIFCKKEFKFLAYPSAIKRGRGKYCSSICSNRDRNLKSKNLLSINVSCEICNKSFLVKPSRYKRCKPRFCSKICFAKKIVKICEICNKKYQVQRWNIDSKQCSKVCHNKATSILFSGSGSHTWKGGITPQRVIDRNTPQIRKWKRDVFKRDRFTCVLCGKHGGYLIADHYPFPFYKYIDKRTELSNGRTLCTNCNAIKTYKDKEWAYA